MEFDDAIPQVGVLLDEVRHLLRRLIVVADAVRIDRHAVPIAAE